MEWGEHLLRAVDFADGEIGFMELASPSIPEAARRLLAKGYQHLLVLPAFVMGARHAREDIPAILRELAREAEFATVRMDYLPGIAGHPLLLAALAARLDETLAGTPPAVLSHSELLLLAHGSSDTAANHAVQQVAEQLGTLRGFGKSRAVFCASATPLAADALQQISPTTQQVIILPLFILPSAPVQQVYGLADALATRQTSVRVLKAECLGYHPLLIDTFRDLIHRALQATP